MVKASVACMAAMVPSKLVPEKQVTNNLCCNDLTSAMVYFQPQTAVELRTCILQFMGDLSDTHVAVRAQQIEVRSSIC